MKPLLIKGIACIVGIISRELFAHMSNKHHVSVMASFESDFGVGFLYERIV
jgi:hypothetical protein